jgi:predicted MFS family arabinose efflux permease
MSMVVMAMILGMAGGSWLAGMLIDWLGAYRTGALPAMAALVALVIAVAWAKPFTHSLDSCEAGGRKREAGGIQI